MLLVEGMSKASTSNERAKSDFLEERTFWRNVLESDSYCCVSVWYNIDFRGSEENLGSPHNGSLWGLFEFVAKRDVIFEKTALQNYLQIIVKDKITIWAVAVTMNWIF